MISIYRKIKYDERKIIIQKTREDTAYERHITEKKVENLTKEMHEKIDNAGE